MWAKAFDDEPDPYEEIVVQEGYDVWHGSLSGLAYPLHGGLDGTLFQLPYIFRVPAYPSARFWPGSAVRSFGLAGGFAYNLYFASEISQYHPG